MTVFAYILIGVIVAFVELGIAQIVGFEVPEGEKRLLLAYMTLTLVSWPVVVFVYLAIAGGIGVIAASSVFFGVPYSVSQFKERLLYLTS